MLYFILCYTILYTMLYYATLLYYIMLCDVIYYVLLIITINVIIITMPSLLLYLSPSLLISHPSIYPFIHLSINASISSNQRCSEGVHERSHRRRLLGGLSSLLAATTDAQVQWHRIRLVGNIDRWIE